MTMTHEDSNDDSVFTLVDYSVPQRLKPVIHPAVDAPLCSTCQRLDLGFFDPHCPNCLEILHHPNTSIAEIFAILRQWVPQVQKNVDIFIEEILKRGAHINDRDGLTDMTLLHYASKSGSSGVGDARKSAQTVLSLLQKGADIGLFSRWTHMTALHYATYFDCAPVVELLLKASKGIDINKPCSEFDNGTPLHIAAGNLCIEAAVCLLKYGANPLVKDDLDRVPLGCVPDEGMFDSNSEMSNSALKTKSILREAENKSNNIVPMTGGRAILQSMGIKLGDKVVVGGLKIGTLRFYGATEFAAGMWAGVELDEPSGKNDGSVKGVAYFKCPNKHGIFAPINKISKINRQTQTGKLLRSSSFSSRHSTPSNTPSSSNISRSQSRGDSSCSWSNSRLSSPLNGRTDFQIGDRVIVGHRKGHILFTGETHFSPGWWYGIELDSPLGKNDGVVGDSRYFTCKPKHGIFAPPSRVKRIQESLESSDSMDSLDRTMVFSGRSNLLRCMTGSQSSLSSISSSGSRRKSLNFKKSPSRSNSEFRLVEGMNVYVNSEIGTIRYIGPTDFGDGIWLGVELRAPKGKNDGSVQGKRYFTCKTNYGLLVRPSKVTVRGINGAKLLDESMT